MSDYPATGKLIWVGGVERTVYSQAEEDAALGTPVDAPASSEDAEESEADPFDTEPTFGAPGDDSHAKRTRKKR